MEPSENMNDIVRIRKLFFKSQKHHNVNFVKPLWAQVDILFVASNPISKVLKTFEQHNLALPFILITKSLS